MTDTTRQRHSSASRRWSISALCIFLVVAALPSTLSYNMNVPKIARSHGFSRTRLSEHNKKDTHEETYALRRPTKKRSSSSKVAMHSAVIDHTATVPTFERRMRDMVLGGEKKKTRQQQQQRTSNRPPNVHLVTSLEEYKEMVGEEKEKLVVARFYAPWCKACRAIQPMYYRLATKFTNVKFVEVPVTDQNAVLHQGLGVPSLPYAHIYHPEAGLTEELKISRKYISQFANKLQSYVSGSCELKHMDSASPYGTDQGDDDE